MVRLFLATITLAATAVWGCADTSGVTELHITDIVVGSGAEAKAGQTVRVHYTGWLFDAGKPDKKGQKFDSSKDRNEPFDFPLGAGQVIKGWDEGVQGMKVGEKRQLIIPAKLAYGERSVGPIPANSTLVFDVDLLRIEK